MRHVLVAMIRDEYVYFRRHPINALSGLALSYFLFLMLFVGARYVVPPAHLGSTLEALIVGYWLVLMTNHAFQEIGTYISGSALRGTLEQMFLSPFGFWWVVTCKLVASILANLVTNGVFLLVLMATTGRWLHLPLAVLPLALAPVVQAYAIGLAMGGLVMVYKRLEALYQVGSLVLVALIAAPETASPVVRYLPFNLAVRLLYRVMSEGRALLTLPSADLTFVLVQTGLLLGMGWAVYARAEGVARREGLIGQY